MCLHQHEAAAAERAAVAAAPAAAQLQPPVFACEHDDDGLDEASNRVVELVHAGRCLRTEMHRRMPGNGYCARPVEMDCHFESICEESCTK